MASMSKKEKKELMNKISSRIEKEVKSFNENYSKYASGSVGIDVLDNMVDQFYGTLDSECLKVKNDGNLDQELGAFFSEQYSHIGIMEKFVYEIEPSIFKNKVEAFSKKIEKEYSICINSKSEFSSHLDEFQKLLSQLQSFINRNVFNDEAFSKDERFKIVIDSAEKSINMLSSEIANLELKNNSLKKSYSNKKKTADDLNFSAKTFSNVINDDVDYVSLAATISSYVKDFEESRPVIFNNGVSGNTDAKYSVASNYIDILYRLLKETSDKSKSSKDIKEEFLKTTQSIEKDLGYRYKPNVKKRKIITVKKLGWGLGGLALGTYGISSLMFHLSFFYKFGFLYPSVLPFIGPVALTIISGIMFKKALGSKEKSIVKTVFYKLKDKKELLEDWKNNVKNKKRR